jgi:hypothetical protein
MKFYLTYFLLLLPLYAIDLDSNSTQSSRSTTPAPEGDATSDVASNHSGNSNCHTIASSNHTQANDDGTRANSPCHTGDNSVAQSRAATPSEDPKNDETNASDADTDSQQAPQDKNTSDVINADDSQAPKVTADAKVQECCQGIRESYFLKSIKNHIEKLQKGSNDDSNLNAACSWLLEQSSKKKMLDSFDDSDNPYINPLQSAIKESGFSLGCLVVPIVIAVIGSAIAIPVLITRERKEHKTTLHNSTTITHYDPAIILNASNFPTTIIAAGGAGEYYLLKFPTSSNQRQIEEVDEYGIFPKEDISSLSAAQLQALQQAYSQNGDMTVSLHALGVSTTRTSSLSVPPTLSGTISQIITKTNGHTQSRNGFSKSITPMSGTISPQNFADPTLAPAPTYVCEDPNIPCSQLGPNCSQDDCIFYRCDQATTQYDNSDLALFGLVAAIEGLTAQMYNEACHLAVQVVSPTQYCETIEPSDYYAIACECLDVVAPDWPGNFSQANPGVLNCYAGAGLAILPGFLGVCNTNCTQNSDCASQNCNFRSGCCACASESQCSENDGCTLQSLYDEDTNICNFL